MELQLRNEPLRTETLHSGAWSLRGGQWDPDDHPDKSYLRPLQACGDSGSACRR